MKDILLPVAHVFALVMMVFAVTMLAGLAGILVAPTNSDEVNMLACHIAWTLYRTPKKIARGGCPRN